jgi:hypothetical protein
MKLGAISLACLVGAAVPVGAPAFGQCSFVWSNRDENFRVATGTRDMIVFDLDGPGPQGLWVLATTSSGGTGDALMQRWTGTNWDRVAVPVSGSSSLSRMLVHDDDGGGPHRPALYVVGNLVGPGSTLGILRNDGGGWAAVGTGLTAAAAYMATYDADGPGPGVPTLFAAGSFPFPPGAIQRGGIAQWNGTAWTALGTGINTFQAGLGPMISYDADGAGPGLPVLVTGGTFTSISGVTANNLAAWNGTGWVRFDTGVLKFSRSFAIFDADGDGPGLARLYAAGRLTNPNGGADVEGVARYNPDTAAWERVGGVFNTTVNNISVHDEDLDGPNPPALFATGAFASVGGVTASRSAVLIGDQWAALAGTFGQFSSLDNLYTVDFDLDGPRPPLLAATGNSISELDGIGLSWFSVMLKSRRWVRHEEGFDREPAAFFSYDPDGSGPANPLLLAGGPFRYAPKNVRASRLAAWDGASWSEFAGGVQTASQSDYGGAYAFLMHDPDASGPLQQQMFVGGSFLQAGGSVAAASLARYDGAAWHAVGGGTSGNVSALASYDRDGNGPAQADLYAGGGFSSIGGVSALNIARWDNAAWSALRGGIDEGVYAMEVFDRDGPAGPFVPLLAIGGPFSVVDGTFELGWGTTAWNGTQFLATSNTAEDVGDLLVFDADGPGTFYGNDLYMTSSQWPGIARAPNGRDFVDLPGWFEASAYQMVIFDDDGAGPGREALYFTGRIGSESLVGLYKWNGSVVSAPLARLVTSSRLIVHDDDGPGPLAPALYCGIGPGNADGTFSQYPGRYGQPLAPDIHRHPASKSVKAHATLRLQCWAKGDVPVTYSWRRDGAPLPSDPRISGAETPTLVINGALLSDAGEYTAVVSYSCGSVTTLPGIVDVVCIADFSHDGQVDFFDYLDFALAFSADDPAADVDQNGQIDFFDYLEFAAAFDAGC